MSQKFEDDFAHLSRTQKAEFISKNIEYCSDEAMKKYVNSYFLDILKYFNIDQIKLYLAENGFTVKEKI